MVYWVLKKVWSERALKARGYQPWTWNPLPFPYDSFTTFPVSQIAFKGWVKRLMRRFGAGTYRVLRNQFFGEGPSYKSVVMFTIRKDGAFKIEKRYTQHPSHPSGEAQAYWKQPQKRIQLALDVRKRMRERRQALREKMRGRIKRPERPKLTITGRTWKMERH